MPASPAAQFPIRLSIIVPVLDEAAGIAAALAPLQPLRRAGVEVIVVDGGSRDATPTLAAPLADLMVNAPRGRGSQMNAGAARARGDVLLFLHADTRLPDTAPAAIAGAVAAGACWGRFDVTIAGRITGLGLVASMMNLRSRLTGIATGDQALFVTRAAFDRAGGFPDIPLMEDIVLSGRLRVRTLAHLLCHKSLQYERFFPQARCLLHRPQLRFPLPNVLDNPENHRCYCHLVAPHVAQENGQVRYRLVCWQQAGFPIRATRLPPDTKGYGC